MNQTGMFFFFGLIQSVKYLINQSTPSVVVDVGDILMWALYKQGKWEHHYLTPPDAKINTGHQDICLKLIIKTLKSV